mgnify:CR=1 FL=1
MNKKNNFFIKRRTSYEISNNLLCSFKYAFNGIFYCFRSTRNFRIQLFFAIVVFLLAFIFNLKIYEYCILFSTVISVLIFELLNTSVESLVDLFVESKFNKLAQISKDCSAGAVLLVAINSIFVAGFIFIPKIKLFIQTL